MFVLSALTLVFALQKVDCSTFEVPEGWSLQSQSMSADQQRCAYVLAQQDGWDTAVHFEGVPLGPFPGRVALLAMGRDAGIAIAVEGHEGEWTIHHGDDVHRTSKRVSHISLSHDGNEVAWAEETGAGLHRTHAVFVDGKPLDLGADTVTVLDLYHLDAGLVVRCAQREPRGNALAPKSAWYHAFGISGPRHKGLVLEWSAVGPQGDRIAYIDPVANSLVALSVDEIRTYPSECTTEKTFQGGFDLNGDLWWISQGTDRGAIKRNGETVARTRASGSQLHWGPNCEGPLYFELLADGSWQLSLAGHGQGKHEVVSPLQFAFTSGGALAFLAFKEGRQYWVLDGKRLSPHERAEPIVFSADGRHHAYAVATDELMVDEKRIHIPPMSAEGSLMGRAQPVLGPRGRHLAIAVTWAGQSGIQNFLCVLDVAEEKCIATYPYPHRDTKPVFSPSGDHLAWPSRPGGLSKPVDSVVVDGERVWSSTESGEPLYTQPFGGLRWDGPGRLELTGQRRRAAEALPAKVRITLGPARPAAYQKEF